MLDPRANDIRIVEMTQQVQNQLRYDVSSVGDYRAVAGLTDEGELFVELYQRDRIIDKQWKVTRITFDHDTTTKIRLLFKREGQ